MSKKDTNPKRRNTIPEHVAVYGTSSCPPHNRTVIQPNQSLLCCHRFPFLTGSTCLSGTFPYFLQAPICLPQLCFNPSSVSSPVQTVAWLCAQFSPVNSWNVLLCQGLYSWHMFNVMDVCVWVVSTPYCSESLCIKASAPSGLDSFSEMPFTSHQCFWLEFDAMQEQK